MNQVGWRLFLIGFLCLLIMACENNANYAPVIEVSTIEPLPKTGMHRVTSGETLYEIAWRYGLDYRLLAVHNQIKDPLRLYTGQLISLQVMGAPITTSPEVNAKNTSASMIKQTSGNLPILVNEQHNKPPLFVFKPQASPKKVMRPYFSSEWVWPAEGGVLNSFSQLHKGINIAGRVGEPIYAASAGRVVYCGDGIRGYGNLIIIKHNSVYLSAYAHNRMVVVKEGEWVQAGQKIAEMGHTGTDKVMLHFEIRRAGKPIDPVTLYHRTKI